MSIRCRSLLGGAAWILSATVLTSAEEGITRPEDVGLSSRRLDRLTRWIEGEVEKESIAGAVTLVARRGAIAYFEAAGMADRETNLAMKSDAIFRIRSMTKPVVSLAVLMLHEEGGFLLDDPISRFIPELRAPRVFEDGDTVPADREITIHDLLTHRSGLTYGFINGGPVGELYRKTFANERDLGTTAELVRRLGELPLAHQPGTVFEYGRSTDVLGRLVEIVSGGRLDRFLRERILDPLGMKDTRFYLSERDSERLVTLYERKEKGLLPLETANASPVVTGPRTYFSGGGGLVSTAADYYRFLRMLSNGGELEGVRLVSPKTIELMTRDHVPEEIPIHPGYGFGLGFAVRKEQGTAVVLGSPGDYTWGGIENTVFWVDPVEELILIFMTNFTPYDLHQRWYVKTLVYQAIID